MTGKVIAAVSTPPGKGGVAIIRTSGEGSLAIADKIFKSHTGKSLGEYPSRTQVYGYILDKEEKVDDCLVTLFKRGSSYTGEETVEYAVHGGRLLTEVVLELLFIHGAEPAEAGEFTRRAFLNGRLSLTDAEAIGTLLDAASREQIRLCAEDARGRLSEELRAIRQAITTLLATLFASIDYPDEDLGELDDGEIAEGLLGIQKKLSALIDSYRTGRAISEGISTVLVGSPNAGKSSLYNLLLGEDAAIVTDVAGTTRDVLERTVPMGRVLLRLSDTAGIRKGDSPDPVERIGIERSRAALRRAELIIALKDGSRPTTEDDREVWRLIKDAPGAKICIVNKSDLTQSPTLPEEGLFDRVILSSVKERGTELRTALTDAAEELLTDRELRTGECAIVSSARQHASLIRAKELIDSALCAHLGGVPRDAVCSDIEGALSAIGELDGRAVSEAVVGEIFSKFCVGK